MGWQDKAYAQLLDRWAQLEPCPWCGSHDHVPADLTPGDNAREEGMQANGKHVQCAKCGAMGPARDTWKAAMDAWDGKEEK